MLHSSDIAKISASAMAKYRLCKEQPLKYLVYSIMAGFYLVVAIVLSNVAAAVLYPTFPQFAKLIGALLFPTAIVLIVFVGGELFTGNNMTMAVGSFDKKVSWTGTLRVWLFSYVGNFIGSFLLAFLFVKSGSCASVLTEYYDAIIMPKLELDPLQMLLRGALCNFMVCLAVFIGFRMQSESGKLVLMFMVITAFVICGFEHSIANMGTYVIAYFLLGSLPIGLVAKSMLFVTIGNILGGTVLLALPIKLMEIKENEKKNQQS